MIISHFCLFIVWIDELKEFFSKFGKVLEHEIIHDHATKRSRGFGFVVFDNEKVVDDILANGNMIEMNGSRVSLVIYLFPSRAQCIKSRLLRSTTKQQCNFCIFYKLDLAFCHMLVFKLKKLWCQATLAESLCLYTIWRSWQV